VRLLILPDPANVFAPSDNAILLPLSLPEAPIGILPTTSPPARSTAEVDMSAFDENMDPSSSSLSSSLKRDRDSPAEVKPVGTKVRILPLRMRVFLLFSMGVLEAFFYRGLFRRLSFLFPCSFRRQTRALVVLGPGAAHGCPPASATRDCGAHKHKNPGRDPKSHGGGPGRNCSRGARKAFLFRSPFYRGGLGNWGALGVGSRGGAGPKMPHPWCPAGRCRGHDLKRPQPRFWPLCWSR
jgi:hypothetical protein